MFLYKIVFSALIVTVNCRQIKQKHVNIPAYFVDQDFEVLDEDPNRFQDDFHRTRRDDYAVDKTSLQDFEGEILPQYLRFRRQLHGSMNTNPDGSANLNAKLPLAGNDNNQFSALGSVSGLKNDANNFGPGSNQGPGYGAAGGGLMLENRNGHALGVIGQHIPTFGDQLTGVAKVNLLHTDNHKLDVNAFVTRNMPKFEGVPNFNTYGGLLNYLYKDKIGGSLGMSYTDLLKRTDYSAMGNYNIFRGRDSSLDLNAGFSKSVSPYNPHSSWEPSGGISYTKYW